MRTIERLFRALGIALSLTLGLSVAQAAEPPVRIMPLGDSLTSGLSTASVPGAYRNRLYTLLSNAGYNVDFVGTFTDSGNAALPDINHQGQGSARIDQIQGNLPTWLNSVEDPDVVLLLIGTNDFWANYQTATATTRLANLIADIANRRPFAKIIVSNLPLRTDNASIEAQQVAFNATLPAMVAQQVALGRQVSLVDMHSAWTAADLNGDGVHPTAPGFEKMANVWFPAIAGVISPQGTSNRPHIARLTPSQNLTQLSVVFSKPVADDAASLSNFSVSGGLTLSGASLDAATKRVVTLSTSSQTPGIVYQLSVSGVRDRTAMQNVIAPGSMATFTTSPLSNGSFEDDYAGWIQTGNQMIKSGAPYSATDGTKVAAFNTGQSLPNATLSQTFATTPGLTYQLSFDFGVFGYSTAQQRVQVTLQGATSHVNETLALNGTTAGITKWLPKSYNFTANSATTTLTFTDVSLTSLNQDAIIDNVRVGAQSTRSLAITSTPSGGANMLVSPADTSGNTSGNTGLLRTYADGATVNVTAPTTHAGISFLKWQKNGVDIPGSQPAISVTMSANQTLNAVYASNTPPVAAADAYSTPAGTTLNVPAAGVLTNDSDPDGGSIGALVNAPPMNGTLALNANGGFVYTPAAGFTGTDSFTYRTTDGVSESNIASVSITVYQGTSQLLVNGSFEADFSGWTNTGNMILQSSAPYSPTNGTKLVAFNAGQQSPNGVLTQSFATIPGQTYELAFDMGAFAYNTSTQVLRVTVDGSSNLLSQNISVTGPGNGTTRWLARSFNFTANSATTTLTFRDQSSTSTNIDLVLDNVRVLGTSASHTLTVNSSPATGLDVAISPPDSTAAAGGTTSFSRSYAAGTIVNLSAPAQSGATAFVKWTKNGDDYSTNRNTSVTIDAAMTLTAVYGNNAAPVAAADSYSTPLNTPLAVPAPGVLANDTDADLNPLTASLVTGATHGLVVLNADGGFSYTPATDYDGPDSFTYRANDGSTNSEIVTVSLNVLGISPGSIANGSFESDETGWTMSGNRVVISSSPPYTPTEGNKLLVFNGAQSTPNGVIYQTFATSPGSAYQLDLDAGVVGAAGAQQRLRVQLTGNAPLVSVTETLTGAGTSTSNWVAKSYFFVADGESTTLTLSDLSTTSSSVDLLVDNVRLSSGTARTLTVNSTPGSGVSVTATPADINSHGSGTTPFNRFHNNGVEVTLSAPASHAGGSFLKWQKDGVDFGTDPVAVVTMDANVTMTAVFAPNTAPVATGESYNTELDSTLTVAAPGLLGNDNDAESQPLTASVVTGPAHGTLTLDADGGFTYTPESGYVGEDTFTYRANDGFLNSEATTVTITITDIAPGTLVNGSFEDGGTGWTITGNHFIVDQTAPYLATDGTKLVVSNGGNQTANATFSQSFATSIGKTYVLELDAGIVASAGLQQVLRVTVDGATQLLSRTETFVGTGLSNAVWTPKSYTFVADSATTTLTLRDQSAITNLADLLIDNVRVSLRIQRALTVNSTPDSGISVSASPNDLDGNGNGSTGFTRTYNNGTVVTLTAPATAGAADFLKWTKNGVDHANTPSTTVTMTGDFTLTAVYGVNHAPVAAADDYPTTADTALTVPAPGVLANDSDEDATPITAVLETTTSHGTLTLAADGGFTYTPDSGFTGEDSFTYRASDGSLSSGAVTVTLDVQPAAPATLVNGSFENGATGWTITGNYLMVDSSTPYLSTDEAKLLVMNGSQLPPNAVATQSFATTPGTTYVLGLDAGILGNAGTQQRFQVTVTGSGTLVSQLETLNGTGVAAPNWQARSYTFVANSSTTTLALADLSTATTNVDLLVDNVRVHPQGTRTLKVTSSLGAGLAVTASPADRSGNGGGVTVIHRFHNNGTVVTLTAPATSSGSNFLKWQKNGVDHATTAETTVTMDGDHTLTAVYSEAPQILVNGSFESDFTGWTNSGNLLVSTWSTPTHGTKVAEFNGGQLAPNGVLSQSFATTPGLTYQLSFSVGAVGYNTLTQTLQVAVDGAANLLSRTVNVQGIGGGNANWVPQSFSFVADSASTTLTFRDTSASGNLIDLLLDNVRVNGGPSIPRTLTVQSAPNSSVDVTVSPSDLDSNANGVTQFTRSFNQGSLVTLTAPASSGALRFSKWTRNGVDFATTPAAVVPVDADLTMTAVFVPNAAPVATGESYSVTMDNALVVAAPGVLANDTDADANPLAALLVSGPSNGTLTLNSNGGFTYTPNSSYQGPDSFTYKANDGLADSNTATVSITVNAPSTQLFTNGSFESDFNGWTATGNAAIRDSAPYSPSNGVKLVGFNGGNTTPNGVVTQTFATNPGTSYTLTFDAGAMGYNTNQQRVQVTVTGNASLLNQTVSVNAPGGGNTRWLAQSFNFTADSAATTLAFRDVSTTTSNVDLVLDNVTLTGGGAATTRTLTVASIPAAGAAITVSPADNGGQGNGSTQFTRTYNNGTAVTLTAPLTFGGQNFAKWQKNGVDAAVTAATTVTMDADCTMTAVYQAASASNLLVNGSFESDLSSWTNTGNLEIQSASPYTSTDGVKLVSFNSANTTPNGVLSQSFATTPGVTYTLAFDAGVMSYGTASQRMQVAVTGNGSLLSQTVTITRTSGSNNLWLPQTFNFVANSATSTVSFSDISTTTSGLDLVLDNARVTVNIAVPALQTLTVNSAPVTAAITVSPGDSNGNAGGTTNFGRAYSSGTVVSLTAPATSGGVAFIKWQKNGVDLTTSTTASVTMDASHTLTAVYAFPGFSNGSFETGTFLPWVASGGTADSVKINSIIGGTDGTRIVEFNSAQSPAGGTLTQTFATTPGVTYSLSFDLGVIAFNTSTQRLLVGVTGSGPLLSQTATINGIGGGTKKWEAKNFTFTANSDTATLTLTDTSTVVNSIDMLLDNVRVINASARTLTVSSISGGAVPVTVSPADNAGNGNGTATFSREYNLGSVVNLTATTPAPNGSTFVKWVKDGVDHATTPSTSVTVSAHTNLVAVYTGGTFPPLGTNLIRNWSFELNPDFAHWSTSGSTRIEKPGPGYTTDGNNILSFNVGGEPNNGTAFQSFATSVGTSYTVQLDVGVYGGIGGSAIDQTLNIKAVGNAVLLDRNATVRGNSTSFVWVPQTYTFVADSTTTTLHLSDVSTSGAGTDLFVDRVRVQAGSLPPVTLAVNSTPAAGKTVTVSPADLASQTQGDTNFNRYYNAGTTVQLVAPYQNFVKWLKNGVWYATNPSINVMMDSSHTLTAVYTTTPVLGPFVNGSFEDEFTGWTWSGSQQSVKVKDGLPSTDGLNVIEFNSNSSANDGSITQTFTTTPGTTYNLTFDMGVLGFNYSQQTLEVTATGSGSLLSRTFSMNGNGLGTVVWTNRSASFTANSATTTLTFRDRSLTGAGIDLLLDNVRLNGSLGGATRTLTVNSTPAAGVAVTVSPADNSSQANGTTNFTRTYNTGATVTLTAPATSGSDNFLKWQRNGADFATTATTTVTMDGDHTMTAVYQTSGGGSGGSGGTATLANGSFESGLSGWTTAGDAGTVATDDKLTATDGVMIAKFNSANTANNGVLSQTIATVSGTTYQVSFDMGVLAFNTSQQSLLLAATGTGTLNSATHSLRGIGNGNIVWSAKTFSFTANSSSTTLSFSDKSTTGSAIDLLLDNVRIEVTAAPGTGPNLILNGSFELSPDFVNWTQTGNNRIEWPGPSYSTDGSKILSYNVGDTAPDGSVSQSFATVPGTTYEVRFDLGVLGYAAIYQTLRVKVDGSGTLLNQTTSVLGRADYVMVWEPRVYTFVANSTTTTLTLSDASSTGVATDMFVDKVRVNSIASSPIPEPVMTETPQYAASAAIAPETATQPAAIGGAPVISGTPGAVRIALAAAEPGRYVLERSDDLKTWTLHGERILEEPGDIEFEDNETGNSRMFYRIGREIPDTGN